MRTAVKQTQGGVACQVLDCDDQANLRTLQVLVGTASPPLLGYRWLWLLWSLPARPNGTGTPACGQANQMTL